MAKANKVFPKEIFVVNDSEDTLIVERNEKELVDANYPDNCPVARYQLVQEYELKVALTPLAADEEWTD